MMKRYWPILLSLLLAWQTWAGPAEEFAVIVDAIKRGDQLLEQGKDRPAMEEYRRAQEALLKFRTVYPDWDQQVVAFRLRYVGDRLTQWSEPGKTSETAPDAEVQALRNRITFLERSSQQYQAQVNQLITENNRLSARLREALAIRPAAEDPAVIAETRSKLEQAEKEVVQLKSQIADLQKQIADLPKPEEIETEAKQRDEAAKKLKTALADAETLRKENASLKQSLRRAESRSKPAADLDEALAAQQQQASVVQSAMEMELNRLRSTNETLRARLATNSNPSVSAPASGPGALKRVDRARLALANGQNVQAVQLLSEELAAHDKNVEAWYLMGRARLAGDDPAEAEPALKRALELSPELGAAHVELARLYLHKSRANPALARWHYHKAVGLGSPRDASLEQSIGWEQPGGKE